MSSKLPNIRSAGAVESARADIRQILWVAVPKVLGGASQLLLSLLLVRFLGVEQFGMVSVCLTGVLLLDAVIGSAIDMAIFRLAPLHREDAPAYARAIEKAGLYIKPIGAALLFAPLAFLAARASQVLFQDPTRGSLLLLSALALLGMLLFRSMQVHFQIESRFAAYGATDLLHTAARLGFIGLLLVSDSATPELIMSAYAVAAIGVAAVGLIFPARPVLSAPWSKPAAGELLGVLKWYLATVVLGSIASRMDVFFVSSFASVAEAGIYGAAQMFALVPHLLGTYLSAVFSPRVLPMWRDGQLPQAYFRYQVALSVAALLLYGGAWVAIGPLSAAVLPDTYRRSVDVALVLLPAGLVALVNFPWTIPFLLYTRPKTLLAVDCVAIPAMAAVFAFAIPRSGASGAAAVSSAFAILRLVFYQGLAWRVLHRDPQGLRWRNAGGATNTLQLARSAS